jgi:hypothetical protein
MVRKAIEKILGCPMSDMTFAQASLTPKLGGLGLRKTVEHANLAFFASWHESQRTAHETWVPRPDQPQQYLPQKVASYNFDASMHAYLVDQAPNDREAQRLRRSAQPHASGFITAVPSSEDGYDTILKPRPFRIAVLYRLGLAVIPEPIPCPLCEQPINTFGDHATCCAKSGDLIVRHNTVRNAINRIAEHGMLAPVLEKKGILGPTSGRRPGDVSIPIWSEGKGLAIDVAVTSSLALSNVRLPEPCEEYAVSQKHKKYDRSFEGTQYEFCAMVFETLGAINEEGQDVLRSLFRYAAKRLGLEFSSYCARAWARLSCTLQRSVAQSILSRIDGREFREPPAQPFKITTPTSFTPTPFTHTTPTTVTTTSTAPKTTGSSVTPTVTTTGPSSVSVTPTVTTTSLTSVRVLHRPPSRQSSGVIEREREQRENERTERKKKKDWR